MHITIKKIYILSCHKTYECNIYFLPYFLYVDWWWSGKTETRSLSLRNKYIVALEGGLLINLLAPDFFLNFSTHCI